MRHKRKKREIRKYFELNKNENTACQHLWVAATGVIRKIVAKMTIKKV